MSFTDNENFELLSLIWLDNMADSTEENREIQEKFRSIVNHVRVFETSHECEHFIKNIINDKYEKIILIVSGRLGQEIIENIHHLKQIISIFVYCFDKDKNELWTKNYKKIRGISVNINDLLKEIENDCKSDEQKINEPIDISVGKNEIIEFILKVKSSLVDKRFLLKLCSKQYENNLNEMEKIQEFQHLYSSLNSLEWFFNETFLYRLLIKSFYINNIELIYLLRFFLQDIHKQLNNCPITNEKVYRGQLMMIDQIDFLNKSINEKFLHFNTFIIAKSNQNKVLESLQNTSNTNGLHKVLFEINSNQIGRQYKEYIIFPITTYFRIISIEFDKRIWNIKIIVYDSYCEMIENQRKNPFEFAHFIRHKGQLDKSEKLFYLLLKQYPSLNSFVYNGLGQISQDKGLYKNSLEFYFKSLDTILFEENRSHCLNNIGCAYDYLEKYEHAMKYYSKALTLMKNDLNQSICLNNIAITYAKNSQHQQAIQCFQQCLLIRKQYLSENNIHLGICYSNLALTQSFMAQFDCSFDNYNLALKCFSSNISPLFKAIVYQNIAKIFQEQKNFDQALKYYKNSEKFFLKFRSLDHPNLSHIKEQIIRLKQLSQTYF